MVSMLAIIGAGVGIVIIAVIIASSNGGSDVPPDTVIIPVGAAVPGCEADHTCYVPEIITVWSGTIVTWKNDDSAAHTVTSGNPSNGSNGIFDSDLFVTGAIFTHEFDKRGTYDYFCLIHPWMIGTVIVR